ncbi:hypothetical protein GGF46_005164 [Coemansia sp. RSA 552]|nr:hypothetical protein GGF46_005164 [Coemansia sp. RSA 552]
MADAAVEKRVYIGGFGQAVTVDEVRNRFKPFGQVNSVDLPAAAAGFETRGFGYVSISITAAQWQRCVKVYTGAKWKGGQLRIEEAKEDYMTRLRREWAETKEVPASKSLSDKKRTSLDMEGVFAEDMALVTAKNIKRYQGWERNRLGRPVLKHSMIRPDGKRLTYDPARHGSIEKLAGLAGSGSSGELVWEYSAAEAEADFARARKLPAAVRAAKDAAEKRVVKKRKIEEPQPVFANDEGFDSDSDIDMESADILAKQLNIGLTPFEDAEEVASLVANAPQTLDAQLRAKLESGVFDSSSEDESDEPDEPQATRKVSSKAAGSKPRGAAMSAEEIALAEERRRTAAILGELLEDSPEVADTKPTDVVEFDGGSPQDGADKKSSKKRAKQAESTDSSSDGSSDGSSDESSDESGSSSGSSSKEASGGGGLFGGDFKFTQMLGLDADEPSAFMQAEGQAQHAGPVTGGVRVSGPAERNLNDNRLPAFFPDMDSPAFKRPDAAFQRQKPDEDLEAELEAVRRERTQEYKALQRATVRKNRKLFERKA